jgi:YbgC/YbaW family acyl-CoA thioester hydrolase
MEKKFHYRFQVLEKHLDTFGHVNNATYLELFEEARWDFITQNGWPLTRIQSEKRGPVILEVQVKFKRELINREWITVESRFQSLPNPKILVMNQQMLKEGQDKVAAEALFTIGFMDLQERKLISHPEDWIKLFQ